MEYRGSGSGPEEGFCPQCGREQKCGCDVCHHCGARLIGQMSVNLHDGGATTHHPGAPASTKPESPKTVSPRVPGSPGPVEANRQGRSALTLILLILGCGAFLFSSVHVIHTAASFIGRGGGFSITAQSLNRFGYYLAYLMYSSSLTNLLAFGLLATGLLLDPPGPFNSQETWRTVVSPVGLLMVIVSAGYLVAFILIMILGGDSVMLVKHLLPSLPGLLPVLAGVGLGLCAGGVLLIRCSHGTSRAVI